MICQIGGARLLTNRLARTLAPPKIQIDTKPNFPGTVAKKAKLRKIQEEGHACVA
jgi:hypothetical protein